MKSADPPPRQRRDGTPATGTCDLSDDRIAMMAAQAILDRGYGKPTQSIDANVTEDGGPVCLSYHLFRQAGPAKAFKQVLKLGGQYIAFNLSVTA
jgi:hypothetical protein